MASLLKRKFIAGINEANGIAGLDNNGKIPANLLPAAIIEYQGVYDASSNSPALSDFVDGPAAGDAVGNVYRVGVAGTRDFGSGNIVLEVGDYLILNADGKWEKSDTTDAVTSVNGKTGEVVLDASDLTHPAGGISVEQKLIDLSNERDAIQAQLDSIEFEQHEHLVQAADSVLTTDSFQLNHFAIPASVQLYADRIALHQGHDYTVSTDSQQNTTITLINAFAPSSMSPESIAEGDTLFVKFVRGNI